MTPLQLAAIAVVIAAIILPGTWFMLNPRRRVTLCTDATRCQAMEGRHSDMAAQLASAWQEAERLKAQLVQARAEAREWQDAYEKQAQGKAFYEAMFCEKCKVKA